MERRPSLVRALGTGDLTWLYLAAVFTPNIVTVIAAEGYRTLGLWIAALLCFFVPQGIAVIELAGRMPGEGGPYLWTKQTFGDFYGFLTGWCYWMTNIFFVPSLLLYMSGILSYLGGARLAENRAFVLILTAALLWTTVLVNIRGLSAGKWINNFGGIGALLLACVLIALATSLWTRGARMPIDRDPGFLSGMPWPTLGMMCLALVGLEIGPVMGDEIRDPRRTIRRSVIMGGILCALAYFGSTASLLIAIPKAEMAVIQGPMQAIDKMSARLNVHWILLPLAVLMAASIAGATSAWIAGSARMLFVSGIDRYLPKALGNTHPRYHSPHVALALFGVLTSAILCMSFIGAKVKEAYVTLLDLSVALQMITYSYLFLTLARVAFSKRRGTASFSPLTLRISSIAGLAATLFALVTAFIPSRQIESIWWFELKMIASILFFLGLACAFFLVRRTPWSAADPLVGLPRVQQRAGPGGPARTGGSAVQ